MLRPASSNLDARAVVLPNGNLAVDDEVFGAPSAAAEHIAGGSPNGWTFWVADTEDGEFTLAALRSLYLSR